MGTTLLRNATIVTMNNQDQILVGDVLLRDDRIDPSANQLPNMMPTQQSLKQRESAAARLRTNPYSSVSNVISRTGR